MKTLEQIADFLEQNIIECKQDTGCGRCDEVRECVESIRALEYKTNNENTVCLWCKKNPPYKNLKICRDCFDAYDK
jgi:hypothetical protein